MKLLYSKVVLLSELRVVKQMCEEPTKYLSIYFRDMSNQLEKQVNMSLEQAKIELTESEVINASQRIRKMQTRLNTIKKEISDKIASFERFCIENEIKIDEKLKTRVERLNAIEFLLNDQEAVDDNLHELRMLIQYEESFVLKHLLNNKTIALVNLQDYFENKAQDSILWDELDDIEDSDFFLDRIPKIEEIENEKSPNVDIYEIEDQHIPYYISNSNKKPSSFPVISESEEDDELTAIYENRYQSNPSPALNEDYSQFVKLNKIRELKRIEKFSFRLVIINDEFVKLGAVKHSK